MYWQPIESAPKDGTLLLLFIPELRDKVQIGSWRTDEHWTNGKQTQSFRALGIGRHFRAIQFEGMGSDAMDATAAGAHLEPI